MKRKVVFSVIGCLAIGGILFISGSKVGATNEATKNQDALNEYLEYVDASQNEKNDDISIYYSEEGKAEELLAELNEENIFEVGNNIIITNDEISQYEEFYELSDSDDPKQDAIDYAEKRNALYVAALENGFDVTDEEIYAYLEELKQTLKATLPDEKYQEIISNFESEEEYWSYEYDVYKVDLPIQNYVASLEEDYKSQNVKIEDEIELDQAWSEEYESIKESLVEQQDYTAVEDL